MASGKPMAVFFGGFNLVGSRAGEKRYYKLISALDFWSRNGSRAAVKAAIVGSAAIMKYGLFSFSLFLQQRKKSLLPLFFPLHFFLKKKMHFITHLPIQTIAP